MTQYFQTTKRQDGSFTRVELTEHERRAYVRIAQYDTAGHLQRWVVLRPEEALGIASGLEIALRNITRDGRILKRERVAGEPE